MRIFALALGLIFCCFPYTQIINLDSYTQPYALAFCFIAAVMSFDQLAKTFPGQDALLLFMVGITGIVFFLATCMPNPTSQDVKYLLIYISPVIFCLAGFAIAIEKPVLTDRILSISAIIWIAVGLIQTVVAPTFATQFVGDWQEAASVVVESGRGVLGLAPEPTHFGFHMIILAGALVLVGGRNILALACIAAAILFARSSSAMLALGLGTIFYFAVYTTRGRFFLLGAIPFYFGLGALIESGALPESLRVVELLKAFYDNPMLAITNDASMNARLGGIYVGFAKILSNFFIPYGMSNQAWVDSIGLTLSQNPWLFFLSDGGIPSGILIVIYQTGIVGLVLMWLMLRRFTVGHQSHVESWLLSSVLFVFLSQYMISTPGFGLIYGIMVARSSMLTERRPAQALALRKAPGLFRRRPVAPV